MSDENITTESPESETSEPSVDESAQNQDTTDWKAEARKHERRLKEANKQLADLQAASMSESEKAVSNAVAEALKENNANWVKQVGGRLVKSEIKAGASGRISDKGLSSLLDGLDVSRFIDDEGEPDTQAIKKFLDDVLPPSSGSKNVDLGQGARGNATSLASPLERDVLKLAGLQ